MPARLAVTAPANDQVTAPQGIAVNSTHILVADSGNHRIQIFEHDGTPAGTFGSEGTTAIGEFTSPYGIATNSTHILITDSGNHRIQIFEHDGTPAGTLAVKAPLPSVSLPVRKELQQHPRTYWL